MYKTHKASVLSYSQTITAPWIYFAHDFLSNRRSNVRSRTNRIFSRVVFFGEEDGCFGLFLFVHVGWNIASQEWFWVAIWLWRISIFFLSLIENCFFSLFTSFRSLIGNPSFLSFVLFFIFIFSFLSLHFSFPIPFFGKSGFSILFALPWRDSAVLCFGGKNEDSFFYRPRFKKVRGCVSMGSFIVGTQSWYLGRNKSGWQGVGLGPTSHIIP